MEIIVLFNISLINTIYPYIHLLIFTFTLILNITYSIQSYHFQRLWQYFLRVGMQSKGFCGAIPFPANVWFFLSIHTCLIWRSLKDSLVNFRQNLFISGERHPGQFPKQQPVTVIIREQRSTQSYFHLGIIPRYFRLLQIVSRARVRRNRARFCLVDFWRNRLDIDPARKPATIDAILVSPKNLLAMQMTALNIPEKHPMNIPKLRLSLDLNILRILAGFLNRFLRENTREMADLILYPNRNDLMKEISVDSTHPYSCLQCTVLSVLKPRIINRPVRAFLIETEDCGGRVLGDSLGGSMGSWMLVCYYVAINIYSIW